MASLGSLLIAAAAAAQVSQGWHGLEDLDNGADHGVDLAYWLDTDANPDKPWVYVAGYVTDGDYTRLAVWRYEADAASGLQAADNVLYFPDPEEDIDGNTKATAIAVDQETGEVYVTGYTQLTDETEDWPVFDTDYNYITIKLNEDLSLSTEWTSPGGDAPAGFRLYDHEGLDDKAVDVIVTEDHMVYVTGKSEDSTTGYDIATLKYEQDGDLSSTWPAGGAVGDGERRFDRGIFNGIGHDAPVGLGWIVVDSAEESDEGTWVFVGGTSPNLSDNDITAIAYDPDARVGSPAAPGVRWARFYNGGDVDVASAIAAFNSESADISAVFVVGYTINSGNTNYIAVAFNTIDGNDLWSPVQRTWNGPGNGTDMATSCQVGTTNSGTDSMLGVTGLSGAGGSFDVGTIFLGGGSGSLLCEGTFAKGNGTNDQGWSIGGVGNGVAYVTGFFVDGNVQNALTLRFIDDTEGTCEATWDVKYPLSGSRSPNAGVRIVVPGPQLIFITGHADRATTGTDALTVRYIEDP